MTYAEQVRHPSGALDPPKKSGGFSWWWFVYGGIAALVLIAIFRPAWLAKIGITFSGAAGAAGNLNPLGWV
jgi:hypothetical protein